MSPAAAINQPSEPVESRSVQSLGVGFRLIDALMEASEPLSLKLLCGRAGLSPGRAHAYLAGFRQIGLVRQDPEGRYELGPYALRLGLSALARIDVRSAAAEPMRAYGQQTGEAIYLSVWSGISPVIISKIDGTRPLPLSIRVGYSMPLVSSATGRLFLAFSAEARGRVAPPWPADLNDVVEHVRRAQAARTDGLVYTGFAALAAPVFDHEGTLAAALTTLGPETQFDISEGSPVAHALAEASRAVSEALGFRVSIQGKDQPLG